MLTSDQFQSRVQAYVQSIPGQTLGLLCTCLGLAIFDLLTADLATEALTLDRAPVIMELRAKADGDKAGQHDFSVATILLLLSCFSAIHGLFSVILSIYFGKDVFSETERADASTQWAFLLHLGLRQVAINLAALFVDWAWFMTFPNAWARLAKFGGFGGLFPLICCLEAEKASADPTAQVELSPLPFTVTRRSKPFLYAFFFSIIGCGDVDLFCGAVLGFVFTSLHAVTGRIRSAWRDRAGASSTTEETITLLPVPTRRPQSTQGTTTTSATGTEGADDAEKRVKLLAAAEKRLAEKQANTTEQSHAADML